MNETNRTDIDVIVVGGGKAVAAINPILGQDNVARFLVAIASRAAGSFEYRFAQINGRPGVVTYVDGQPQNVGTLEIVDGKISSIYIVVNADELQRIPPLHAAGGHPSKD